MIYDTDGNPITSTALSIAPDGEKQFAVLVDCKPGYFLSAMATKADGSLDSDVGVFAKAEPGDSWTDIIAGSLDTEPFTPERRLFYFKIEVNVSADPSTEIVAIRCARS